MLLNIGFVKAMTDLNWDCVVLHDVDYLPENDRAPYYCPEQPRRLNIYCSNFGYKYGAPYAKYYGGVTAIQPKQFIEINGFSNKFFGWGGEDDDLYYRMLHKGLHPTLMPENEAKDITR